MVAVACNPSYSGGWGRRIAWIQEVEVAMSRDHTIAHQPGQQEWDFVSKKKKEKRNLILSLNWQVENIENIGKGYWFRQFCLVFVPSPTFPQTQIKNALPTHFFDNAT